MTYTILAFYFTEHHLKHEYEAISPTVEALREHAAVVAQGIYVLSPSLHKQLIEDASTQLHRHRIPFVIATVESDQAIQPFRISSPPPEAEERLDSWIPRS